MIKSRFAGLILGSALATAVYAHDPSPTPTATPAVYQNAVANTYSGAVPNDSLKAPGPSPSPAKSLFSRMLRPLASTTFIKPAPSPASSQITATPSPRPVKAVASPSPTLTKAMAWVQTPSVSPSPAPMEMVGPPAPKLTKAEVPASLVKSISTASVGASSRSSVPDTERTSGNSSLSYVSAKPLPNPSPAVQKTSAAPATVAPAPSPTPEPVVGIVVSVRDQKLAVVVNGKIYRTYRISTSRYGEGDYYGSWRTPLGHLQVATKIGAAAPAGAVFRRRQLTGEVLAPNAPGRDPIISRIIWLRGTEAENKRAYQRCIYIHGTPQEEFLGRKASYGCIRMRSADVIEVFNWVGIGTNVAIVDEPIRRAVKDAAEAVVARNEQQRGPVPEGSPSEANR
jgi:lipoprotein-anchoring transpeptidase ErfK/SrfK